MFIKRLLENYLDSPQRIIKNIQLRKVNVFSEKTHVFILGAPRSGTTLLQTLISAHPNFYGIDQETALMTHQNVFKSEWRQAFDNLMLTEKMIWDSNDIVQLFDSFAESIASREKSEHLRFVEKTPQHVNYLGNILRWFPNAQILHIHRDGRDCYCSARLHKGIPTGASLSSYANYWKRCIANRQKYTKHPRVYDISYEELTAKTEPTLTKIMDFLGDEMVASQLDCNQRKSDQRSKQSEFSKLAKPVDTTSIGRWRTELSNKEVVKYEQIAKKELQEMGYKISQHM